MSNWDGGPWSPMLDGKKASDVSPAFRLIKRKLNSKRLGTRVRCDAPGEILLHNFKEGKSQRKSQNFMKIIL